MPSRQPSAPVNRAGTTARGRTGGRLRAVPERDPDFAHLSLPGLREYRRELMAEEGRVAYWRRLLQARLDLSRPEAVDTEIPLENLRKVLGRASTRSARPVLQTVLAVPDMPPLPDLAALWHRERTGWTARLRRELESADRQLSKYSLVLRRRLDAATGELIARYREDPYQCLAMLPDTPPNQVAGI
jgi:hypothetical protein